MPVITIAIASGKGGTGKTTLAVNLAAVLNGNAELLDCDVEEPNVHVFTDAKWQPEQTVNVPVPLFDDGLCNKCGECKRVCRFNAIALLPTGPMLFNELCHSCGGCVLACPQHAITEGERGVGTMRTGTWRGVTVREGRLNIGEAKSPPLIEAVRQASSDADVVLIDAPPGSSCPVVAAVTDADYLVLVTEPTPFGLHDFRLAAEMARQLGVPCGAVINRAGIGDAGVHDYCQAEGIEILAEIPFDRRIAESYSGSGIIVDELPEYRPLFIELLARIIARAEIHAKQAIPADRQEAR